MMAKDSQTQEFTKAEQQLIKRANQLAPGDFLAAKKQQLHGFVGSAETGILCRLQQRAVLPLPVINMLIDYILNNSATLTQILVETVANDWVQNNIRTAGAAVKRIKARANGSGKKAAISGANLRAIVTSHIKSKQLIGQSIRQKKLILKNWLNCNSNGVTLKIIPSRYLL